MIILRRSRVELIAEFFNATITVRFSDDLSSCGIPLKTASRLYEMTVELKNSKSKFQVKTTALNSGKSREAKRGKPRNAYSLARNVNSL